MAGWTTNEITITTDAVLSFETFKCAIKDTDTSAGNASANKVVYDIISFTDMSDPVTVDLVSQGGFTIKSNGNDVGAKAVLHRGGEEIDAGGTAYTYTWKLQDSAGASVVKTCTGKSITISKADVTGKGVLTCGVSKQATCFTTNTRMPNTFQDTLIASDVFPDRKVGLLTWISRSRSQGRIVRRHC